jgi:hypothetical protein
MACSIDILSITGRRNSNSLKPFLISVTGTAQGCEQVRVYITCGGPDAFAIVDVSATGGWSVEFSNLQLQCACSGHITVRAICVDHSECSESRAEALSCVVVDDCPYVDGIKAIIDLDLETKPCVDGPTQVLVNLTASGMPGLGKYVWDYGDGSPTDTIYNSSSASHAYSFPNNYTIKLTYDPAKAGCSDTLATHYIEVPDCSSLGPPPTPTPPTPTPPTPPTPTPSATPPTPPATPPTPPSPVAGSSSDGGSGSGGCGGLLWAAIALIFGGSLLLAITACLKVTIGIIIGAAASALGLLLFGLWLLLCGRLTSCAVMRSIHCFLYWYVTIITPLAVIFQLIMWLSGSFSLPCFAGLFGHLGLMGWLYAQVGKAMTKKGCVKTCG